MYSLREDLFDAARVLVRNASWVAACLAVLADVLSTLAALSVGGQEANPLIANLVNSNPDSLWLLGGIQIALFAGFGWLYLGRRDRIVPWMDTAQWTVWFVFAGIAAYRFAVSASNMDVYRQLAAG